MLNGIIMAIINGQLGGLLTEEREAPSESEKPQQISVLNGHQWDSGAGSRVDNVCVCIYIYIYI